MKVSVETNKTKTDKDHRMTFTVKEIRDFVLPRFNYMKDRKYKMVKWHNHDGLELWYKKFDGVVKVAFVEPGGGYPETFYSIDELEQLLSIN